MAITEAPGRSPKSGRTFFAQLDEDDDETADEADHGETPWFGADIVDYGSAEAFFKNGGLFPFPAGGARGAGRSLPHRAAMGVSAEPAVTGDHGSAGAFSNAEGGQAKKMPFARKGGSCGRRGGMGKTLAAPCHVQGRHISIKVTRERQDCI